MSELHKAILEITGQKPELVDLPDLFGSLLSHFGWLPGAPLTRDQWLMLQRDNVAGQGRSRARGVRDPADAARRRSPRNGSAASTGAASSAGAHINLTATS